MWGIDDAVIVGSAASPALARHLSGLASPTRCSSRPPDQASPGRWSGAKPISGASAICAAGAPPASRCSATPGPGSRAWPAAKLILGVDDAQRLHPTSAALVLHLARCAEAWALAALADVDARSDSSLIEARAAHATALVARDGTALLAAADLFEGIGALRYGCEAADGAQTGSRRLIRARSSSVSGPGTSPSAVRSATTQSWNWRSARVRWPCRA